MNRREFARAGIGALATFAARPAMAASAIGAGKTMRGAFIILATPFTASGEVDWDDLTREAVFVDRCGAQGIVWPQGSSGVANLTKVERMHGMQVLAEAAQGKSVSLALGVQGKNIGEMLEYAHAAEQLAPDAMIAMPPSSGHSMDEYRDYFRALAQTTSRPIIVQTSGGARDLPPTVDLIVELAREHPHMAYVKEESAPVVERMRAEVRQRPPLKGIFGASFGTGWLYEMRMGLDGVITGMPMYPDLMARIWALHEQHDADALREAYARFLLMRNISQQIPGTDLYLLKKRGVFKTTAARTGGSASWKVKTGELSPDEMAEIDYRFSALKPYLS